MAKKPTLHGKGYLYQGIWLGFDPAAFQEVSIELDEISSTERNEKFVRVITKTGHVYVIFEVYDPRLPPVGRVVDATVEVVTVLRKLPESQDSPKPARRIIALPPPKESK